ncbi:GNAT family N-acetyltransferase [Paenibacillus selenitireducens]|uniref:GNAT family N-acetyltransferase n=1 Tax=Paenibacillus selenitireducens TaxID=1324314 RepID=A0A1T2X6M6_9BACL|nr:GNAT family N-acetyltransferase [Paenibacillus selenitireducens]OPA75326.1 GNAT family N-acetyltransferase [Paenibacillus selenitireducens]
MNYFPEIETQRLFLRELNLSDCESVFRHFSDPEVTQFMDIEPCKDMKEAEEIIQFHMDDSGCRYGLFHRTNGEFVGTCGFHCWVKGIDARAEIGFDLSRRYWGLGLMQEALTEMIKIGFDVMEINLVEATVEQDNVRSQQLLNKMGFSREEELRDNLVYYTLRRK